LSSVFRIEIDSKEKSSEAGLLGKKLKELGFGVKVVGVSAVYTIKYDFSDSQIKKIGDSLHNELVHNVRINKKFNEKFDWGLELGFLPGVTDNVANTTAEIINDLFKIDIGLSKVFSSKLIFIESSSLQRKDVEKIANELINILIERFHVKSYDEYVKDGGMDYITPAVKLTEKPKVVEVDLDVNDNELAEIGKKGVLDLDTKQRRGPLALDLDYLHAIKDYFSKQGRKPTDIEIESIAQTWSEHCKHTYFSSRIDEIKEGIYSKYIKGATNKIRKELGEKDFCVSVFKDNSGGIIFNDDWIISDKAETHNSPSALDPFGGAITGIVGVNRDTLGFGMCAKPIVNKYGYCFGRPEDKSVLYRGKNKTNPSLSRKRILEGVVDGVNVGGNCSGIPTPQGFVYFDDDYRGKPLVFVGTVGLIPRKLNDGSLSYEKKALPGDNIVMIGGRVGKDGVHGATFSSEVMDEGSPATAVQIGDPITQKKLSDALVYEAREKKLYNSITDNGAGGISCSVAEMAKECGGFELDMENVPLKYPGLQPWETWISESQERMTLSVPDDKLKEFMDLMKSRGVETSVLGKFTDSGKAVVKYKGKDVLNIDMDFLHEGLPAREFDTTPYNYDVKEPKITVSDHNELFEKILGGHNVCSFEFISKQYDHEVQNNSVVKPLQGKGRVNNVATVVKPLFDSNKGVVMSNGICSRMSRISTYDMAVCAIDTAIRNAVAVGGNINHTALMDNFCWCSSNEPERLAQVKDAAKACYDYAIVYKTPFISGKDSMFNDFKGFDENGDEKKISVPPTLMISSLSVIEDIHNTTTMDLKFSDDLVYVIGSTKDECGASEFYHAFEEVGEKTPKVDAKKARKLYEKMHELHKIGIFSACSSINVGGLGITLAKMSIAGMLGMNISLENAPNNKLSVEKIMYSESASRFVVTINPSNKQEFDRQMKGFVFSEIGEVTDDRFVLRFNDKEIISSDVKKLERIYKQRFKEL